MKHLYNIYLSLAVGRLRTCVFDNTDGTKINRNINLNFKIMKTIKFTIVNGVTTIEKTIEVTSRKDLNLNLLVGTVCNELFHKVDRQKQGVYKLFKLNQPFDLILECKGIKVDTFKIDKSEKTKLKLNATDERKKAFAKVVFALSEDILRKVEVVDVVKLINKEC